jgi:hypothetical protein
MHSFLIVSKFNLHGYEKEPKCILVIFILTYFLLRHFLMSYATLKGLRTSYRTGPMSLTPLCSRYYRAISQDKDFFLRAILKCMGS